MVSCSGRSSPRNSKREAFGFARSAPLLAFGAVLFAAGLVLAESPSAAPPASSGSASARFAVRYEAALLAPANGPGYRNPSGVTTDFQGNVFVVDTGNHRILQFDPKGAFVFAFGGYGWNDGELSSPTDACAREGFRLLVADAGNERVQQFDIGDTSPEGSAFPFREGSGFSGEALVRPSRLDVDSEGRMYVSDSLCHCIWVFTPTGELVNRLGGLGSEPSRLRDPAGVAVGGKGRVYVADAGNRRVQVFDTLGNWRASWGAPDDSLFIEPSGIDVGEEEIVYVADRGAAKILLFSSEGRPIFTFGGPGDGPGSFRAPVDLALASDGRIYVVDQERGTVERYRLVRDDAETR